jgi:hypothetical protein
VKSCEIPIFDVNTGRELFNVILYGVSAREMMTVPPPVSVKDLLERRGFDTTHLIASIFHVYPVRRWQ